MFQISWLPLNTFNVTLINRSVYNLEFSSVQTLSRVWLFATPWITAGQASLSITPTPRVHSDPRPSSQWCHPAISSSVVPFSSCPQSLPVSDCFLMSQLFAPGNQSTGVSGSKSCTQCASTFGKFSPGFRTGKYQFWFKSQRKAMPKNGQTEAQLLHSSHMLVK